MKSAAKGLTVMLFICLAAIGFGSCADNSGGTQASSTAEQVTAVNSYEQISAEQAKRLMDSETDFVIIDARTLEEYDSGHIKGAVLIPEYEIAQRAESELPDKNGLILVYCRSGRRSKIACEALAQLGYTKVKEFGGIIDWPYDIVK